MPRDAEMRMGKTRGSYMPVLSRIVQVTTGPILELGIGFCSTPYLHWACYPMKRRLVSYENNPEYFKFGEAWKDVAFHEVHCIADWDAVDLSQPWSIAFVDHCPNERRWMEVAKVQHADYVVCHDAEGRNDKKYQYSKSSGLFTYRYDYSEAYPHTAVFSNKFDPKFIFVVD